MIGTCLFLLASLEGLEWRFGGFAPAWSSPRIVAPWLVIAGCRWKATVELDEALKRHIGR